MKYPPKQIGLKHIDWVALALSTELPTISKAIVMYLSRFMNRDQDIAWPSQARMLAELSLSNGALNNHLNLLESEGWVIRDKGNSQSNTRYQITFPQIVEQKLHQMENTPPDGVRTPPDGVGVLHEMETNRQLNNPSNSISTAKAVHVASKADAVPFSQILNLYHEILPDLPKTAKLTNARKGQIRQRWNNGLPDLENWKNFFEYVRGSDFLMGRAKSFSDRPPFRASLEWITKENNYVKILEGKYHE